MINHNKIRVPAVDFCAVLLLGAFLLGAVVFCGPYLAVVVYVLAVREQYSLVFGPGLPLLLSCLLL